MSSSSRRSWKEVLLLQTSSSSACGAAIRARVRRTQAMLLLVAMVMACLQPLQQQRQHQLVPTGPAPAGVLPAVSATESRLAVVMPTPLVAAMRRETPGWELEGARLALLLLLLPGTPLVAAVRLPLRRALMAGVGLKGLSLVAVLGRPWVVAAASSTAGSGSAAGTALQG